MAKTAKESHDTALLNSWDQDFYAYLQNIDEYWECKKKLKIIMEDETWQKIFMEAPNLKLHFIHEWLKYTYTE